ncbi:caspase family protein [Mesorhizobium sp.]|uniref:caspase family protein n=1 Tax=Mesorhizobium sp. TaxID=1871066 RepID=UPI00257C5FAA|nr:caspase family protein [Mesorhizobium sp.]
MRIIGSGEAGLPIEFSRDSTTLVSSYNKNELALWDTETGLLKYTLNGNESDIGHVAFSPDDKSLLTPFGIWDLSTKKQTAEFQIDGFVSEVSFSFDGTLALVQTDGGALIWDTVANQKLQLYEDETAACLSILNDKPVAVRLQEKSLSVVEPWTGKTLKTLGFVEYSDPHDHLNCLAGGPFAAVSGQPASESPKDGLLPYLELQKTTIWDLALGSPIFTTNGHFQDSAQNGLSMAIMEVEALTTNRSAQYVSLWDIPSRVRVKKMHLGTLSRDNEDDYLGTNAYFSADLRIIATRAVVLIWFGGVEIGPPAFTDLSKEVLVRQPPPVAETTNPRFSPDGKTIVSNEGIWSANTGTLFARFPQNTHVLDLGELANKRAGVLVADGKRIAVLDAESQKTLLTFKSQGFEGDISPDGTMIATVEAAEDTSKDLIEVRESLGDGSIRLTFKTDVLAGSNIAFSPNGKTLGLIERNLDNSRRLRLIDISGSKGSKYIENIEAFVFSPKDNSVIAIRWNGTVLTLTKIDVDTKAIIWESTDHLASVEAIFHLTISPVGDVVAANGDGEVLLWSAVTGDLIRAIPRIPAPNGPIQLQFSPDGKRLVGTEAAAEARVWMANSGSVLATIYSDPQTREWVTITPSGYFVASDNGAELVSVVRGLTVYPVGRFYEHLSRADLVEESLKGDPQGEYADAAWKLNLQTILNSGSVPQLALLSDKQEIVGDTVKATIRIVDTGGGIARKVVWRVNNGIRGSNLAPAPTPEGVVVMTNYLRMDLGKTNLVTVIAYNSAGLMASDPLQFAVDKKFGITPQGGARLFVLAIGAGGTGVNIAYPKLRYPEKDAEAIAGALTLAGKRIFVDTVGVSLTGPDARWDNIAPAFEELAKKINPSDVFVLFLSGHGQTRQGRYYFIPQEGADGPWGSTWIGQNEWEIWLSRIAADKQLILLDTCEGEAALGLVKGRSRRETAIDHLKYATGHSIIAAAEGEAREAVPYKHGLLTYSILNSLRADPKLAASDEPVTVFDLARNAEREVREIRERLWKEPIGTINRMTKNDFPIGYRVPIDLPDPDAPASNTARYVVLSLEQVRLLPKVSADLANRTVSRGDEVDVIQFNGDNWALIGKDGEELGYVPIAALLKLND